MSGWACARAAARLHLGFIDLNGELGRHFGSIGLAISGQDAEVIARLAAPGLLDVHGADAARARQAALQALAWLGMSGGVRIDVNAVARATPDSVPARRSRWRSRAPWPRCAAPEPGA